MALPVAGVLILGSAVALVLPRWRSPAPSGLEAVASTDRTEDTGGPANEPLPAPDTSRMTPPVARALATARAAAVAAPDSAAAVGAYCEVLDAHWLNDEAAACYRRARRLAPDEFRWTYLLAGIEDVRGGDPEEIDRLFAEAIRLAPGHAPAYVRHADALLRLGRWAEAGERYARAVELDPALVLAHRGWGQAAILLGDGDAAVEHLERAAEMAPDDRIAQTALARAYALAGRRQRAAEAAERAQQLAGQASLPDQIFFEVDNRAVDPESLRARISRRLREGNLDGALEALALLEESEGPGARRQLARASKERANRLAFAGEFEAALVEYQRAARFDPDDPEIEHNRGTVRLRRGDLEAAGRHFERAIELDPRSADSLYNLGVVLEGQGRQAEAIERFREAAAIEPDHLAARRLAELGAGGTP